MAKPSSRPSARDCTLAAMACLPCAAHGSAIPFRPEAASAPLQLGLGYALALLLLAGVALALFEARKRLGGRQPGAPSANAGLRRLASLRMPMRTTVHVVAWRGHEMVFAQCGERLQILGRFAGPCGAATAGVATNDAADANRPAWSPPLPAAATSPAPEA